jgi:hypothetical protein
LDGARGDLGVSERWAVAAGPADPRLLTQAQQQVELFREELVVLTHGGAEERERLGKGAAAGDDLRAAVAGEVELREVLVDADGVQGAEHGYAAGQPDPFGLPGDGGEHDGG